MKLGPLTIVLLCLSSCVLSYTNNLYTLKNYDEDVDGQEEQCGVTYSNKEAKWKNRPLEKIDEYGYVDTTFDEQDPFYKFQWTFHKYLFRSKSHGELHKLLKANTKSNFSNYHKSDTDYYRDDSLGYYPDGQVLRAELFYKKSAVHLPPSEFIYPGHCHLKLTDDHMQTAVNAFAILTSGNLDDVYRLPREYVLKSARTIAMMKIGKEKLAATWTVVKGNEPPQNIPIDVLELYRPLFHHLNGREIASLNLMDNRILTYIGTHAGLDRHQVGVVTGRYIRINKMWTRPLYLNMMNNLLCGVPLNFMRRLSVSTYLQLSHQTFYHIHACNPLQRRFYLAMMTKSQVLGKEYSWSARDVSRLGLLLSELRGQNFASIRPEAMSGLAAKVMQEIPAENMKYITEMQLRYISQKALNILHKKLQRYQDQINLENLASSFTLSLVLIMLILTTVLLNN